MLLASALSLLVGVALGLLGGGGSVLAVPILVYAAGVSAREAIATSLIVVGTTAAFAAIAHARAGRVVWSTAALFGTAAMAGAYLGGRAAAYIPGTVLLVLFAALMVVTAVMMMRGRANYTARNQDHNPFDPTRLAKIGLEGLGVGFLTGMIGAGGGFLVVPALVLLGGLSMEKAVGTSLVVIAMKSTTAVIGHLGHVEIDWSLALSVTGAAILGSFVGNALVPKVKPELLRKIFAWFIVAMGVFILAKQLM